MIVPVIPQAGEASTFESATQDNVIEIGTVKPVQFYPGKHPCEKPADMLLQIINASSKPADLVADFFMGSGSTVKAALLSGRRAISVELETERFSQAVSEVEALAKR
ncbi:site-specific DNA-methyltransferase [Salmonella enterica subsp. enterica]|nr:site-specific DNA-methyltransferase [Salmonella enterica subsp. enterica]